MLNRGSKWSRWEPHIHTPGTLHNDQFRGSNRWGNYLDNLEAVAPPIRAVGITDYYLTENYEKVMGFKTAGRLPNVHLIFPNVEMRLDAAAKSGFINIHLLASPEDPNHVQELGRILSRLTFSAYDDRFGCTRDELIRLGQRAKPNIPDEHGVLREGATQFKVNLTQLREVIRESDWAKQNILVAVAGGGGDGTSGMRAGADRDC